MPIEPELAHARISVSQISFLPLVIADSSESAYIFPLANSNLLAIPDFRNTASPKNKTRSSKAALVHL